MAGLPDRDELLALVRSSPAYVAAHDRTGWLGIFADQHVVEDPVGSRPVRSEDEGALGRFWDTFIAPNDIVFNVEHDWVDGFDVVRDVTIVTTLRTGAQVETPAHLRYETTRQDGRLKVRRMAAHWESAPVYAQLMRPTKAHVSAALGQNAHMFRTLGFGPTMEFIGAVRSVGRKGKQTVRDAMETELTKVIASGNVVTANTVVDGQPAAVIATLDRKTRDILDLRIYTDLA